MTDLAKTLYAALRGNDSFNFGDWKDLTLDQRAYICGAADAVARKARKPVDLCPKCAGVGSYQERKFFGGTWKWCAECRGSGET